MSELFQPTNQSKHYQPYLTTSKLERKIMKNMVSIIILFASLGISPLSAQGVGTVGFNTGGFHAGGGGATASLVQTQASATEICNATCSVTMSANATAGNLGVLEMTNDAGNTESITAVSPDDGTHLWQMPANGHVSNGSAGIALAYNLGLPGATTTYTITISAGEAAAHINVVLREYKCTGGTWTFDNSNSASNAAASPQSGVTPTLTGSNDVIVQAIGWSNGPAAGGSPYGNAQFVNASFGIADLLNTTSTTPPSWTNTNAPTSVTNYGAWKCQ